MRFIFIIILTSSNLISQSRITEYADPFIGTSGHGHTFPGATLPFGMVQLSPDTGIDGWDWCSGYHSSDSSLMGFSHTHLSGTGAADYGDILIMPTGSELKLNPGTKDNPDEGYRSRFNHASETASPGYYSVYLDDYNIRAELTATMRAGMHRYRFDRREDHYIVFDLDHGIHDRTLESYIRFTDSGEIVGYRRSQGWAKDHTVFFAAKIDKDFEDFGISTDDEAVDGNSESGGKKIKAYIKLNPECNEVIIKIGISHVSIHSALNNLNNEIIDWDFDRIRSEADSVWADNLMKIGVETDDISKKRVFYTSLYHCMIAPNLFSDYDGSYMGMDKKIRKAKDFNVYTVFSLWDTFRALHPLLTIIDRERTADFIRSIISKYEESGLLPVWELAANETGTMIGYHSIPVIADAYVKGIPVIDMETAYTAMKKSAFEDHLGLKYYKSMDYIPMDREEDAVSKTLEYAYDDWCIAQIAGLLGKKTDRDLFIRRAQNYKNLFDTETGFMRGREINGTWKKNFDPAEPFPLGSGEFTEGSSWQYTWFVPQDINTLIELLGGDDKFSEKLDMLFSADSIENYWMPSDVTGLIGQYAHGNEPSHHIAYLYDYCGKAWKTQRIVRRIMDELYTENRDGLCGNEDCGQMSAWYVFSAMGFYPVVPGSDYYVIGSPVFDRVTINLENGSKFILDAEFNSEENYYVDNVKLNGEDYNLTFIKHGDLIKGANFVFTMSDEPSTEFGMPDSARPMERIDDSFVYIEHKHLFEPYVVSERHSFNSKKEIKLACYTSGAEIRYTLDGKEPGQESPLYDAPFYLYESSTVKLRSFHAEYPPGETVTEKFTKAIIFDENDPFHVDEQNIYPKATLVNKYNEEYAASGTNSILDGIYGNKNFRNGIWQGYQFKNFEAVIDMGRETNIRSISLRSLENQGAWIFKPVYVEYSVSNYPEGFEKISDFVRSPAARSNKEEIVEFKEEYDDLSARYIRIKAENPGKCPDWHYGSGGEAWIFIDEVIIEPE